MAVSTEPRTFEGVDNVKLWFGASAGPVLWALYHMLVYGVSSMVCQWNWLDGIVGGVAVGRLVMVGMTVLFTAVVVVAGVTSLGAWRSLRGAEHERPEQLHRTEVERSREPAGRFRFMALFGALASALFALAIAANLPGVMLLDLCATQ